MAEDGIVIALARTSDSPFHSFESFNAKRSSDKAHGLRALSDDESSSEEEDLKDAADGEENYSEWVDSSTELLSREKFDGTKAQYIEHFIRHMIRMWSDKPEQTGVAETIKFGGECCKIDFVMVQTAMKNLCEDLRHRKINGDTLSKLHSFIVNTVNREYVQATQAYVDITIGTTMWHQDVCVGEARFNKGYNYRKIARKEGTAFAENLSQNVKDGRGMESYMLCLKRLQTKAQELRPPL